MFRFTAGGGRFENNSLQHILSCNKTERNVNKAMLIFI